MDDALPFLNPYREKVIESLVVNLMICKIYKNNQAENERESEREKLGRIYKGQFGKNRRSGNCSVVK